jgi:hypothetical protein
MGGEGFVFNDFVRGGDPKNNILHLAGCRWLDRMNMGVPKLYFEPAENPAAWLNANRKVSRTGFHGDRFVWVPNVLTGA